MVLRDPIRAAASRLSGPAALRVPSPSAAGGGAGPSPASSSSSPPHHRHQASSPDAMAAAMQSKGVGVAHRDAPMRSRRSASEGAMQTGAIKRTETGAPESKGAWLPAAIFIALSHMLIAIYMPLYAYAVLRRWASGEAAERGSLLSASSSLIAATLLSAWLNLLGITAGYHRLWSHGSYKASFGLRVFLAIIGLCSFQGSARWWVLKHRIHHRFTDTRFDPYDSTRGLWYSHMGWLFEAPPYNPKTKLISMKDVDQDQVVCFQKRHLLWGYLLFGLLVPGALGWYLDGSFVLGALWIGFVGRFLSWHCIWTINSLSHWEGIREFSRASSAVYVAVVNFVQNGEGHHNYHHCLEASTSVALADGRSLAARLLTPDMQLLGQDGQPVRITALAHGTSHVMYTIEHRAGSYTVTPAHQLTLEYIGRGTTSGIQSLERPIRGGRQTRRLRAYWCDRATQRVMCHEFSYIPLGASSGRNKTKFIYSSSAAAQAAAAALSDEVRASGQWDSYAKLNRAQRRWEVHWERKHPNELTPQGKRKRQTGGTSFTYAWGSRQSVLTGLTEEQLLEHAALWVEENIPRSDRLERGDLFELTAQELFERWDELTQQPGGAVVAGHREQGDHLARQALYEPVVFTAVGQQQLAACKRTVDMASQLDYPVCATYTQLSLGAGHYRELKHGDAVSCVYMLHNPLDTQSIVNAAGVKAFTFTQLERLQQLLQLDHQRGVVVTELNPCVAPTGAIDSCKAEFDAVCSASLSAALQLGTTSIVSFGSYARNRWRSCSWMDGVEQVERGERGGVPFTRVQYCGRSVTVYHAPHPCVRTHAADVARALTLGHGGTETQAQLHAELVGAAAGATQLLNVTRRVGNAPIVSIEVSGNHRYVLADGTLTHNSFPIDFRHGHRWYEWDPTKWCILLWSCLGLAWDLQRTDENEVLQGQTQVLEAEAEERRVKATWPTPQEELPCITEAEFKHLAEKSKGTRTIMRFRSLVLDVTSFGTHPGGSAILHAYHGRDITAAFEGEVNLHTQAAHNLAHMYRIARIQE